MILFLGLDFILDFSCFPPPAVVKLPAKLQNIQGQASCYLQSRGREGRIQLAFYLEPPDKVRLEILNPFGGLESILWLKGNDAFLYVPGQRVGWSGTAGVIMADFLGGEISADELIGIFLGLKQPVTSGDGWEINYDDEGKIIGGFKNGFSFEIKKIFSGNGLPKDIYFRGGKATAIVRVLRIKFNQVWKTNFLNPFFPQGTKTLSWEEISGLWKR
ncbi:MAG: hypothetical protein C0168_01010 [Candidatus Aminicenantes bacterium]|nr:MAG: hypothetical protein C0168_01010 [Candidatus Aminicenantes bacterium]